MAARTDPVPKRVASIHGKDRWRLTSIVDASTLHLEETITLASTLLSRRTQRDLSSLELDQVLALLRFVLQPRETGKGVNSGRMRKVSISAGALHPLEVLVIAGPGVIEPIIFSDAQDAFGTIQFKAGKPVEDEINSLKEIVPSANGHLLLIVGDLKHVAQAYEQPENLLWRDSGALLQTISMLACALGYAFVPLGPSGKDLLASLETPHESYLALGTGIIGIGPVRTAD